MLVSINVD